MNRINKIINFNKSKNLIYKIQLFNNNNNKLSSDVISTLSTDVSNLNSNAGNLNLDSKAGNLNLKLKAANSNNFNLDDGNLNLETGSSNLQTGNSNFESENLNFSERENSNELQNLNSETGSSNFETGSSKMQTGNSNFESKNLNKKSRENLNLNKTKKNFQKRDVSSGPDLADFILSNITIKTKPIKIDDHPYLKPIKVRAQKVYFDVYGCQMNVSDTEIIYSVLKTAGYCRTMELEEADVILVVTCAIREGAEQKIWGRLASLNDLRRRRQKMGAQVPVRIGLLGCMAERLKTKILEESKYVDLVAGPDAYRDLPRLLSITESNQTAINVTLSFDETYADINPVRLNEDSKSAFVTIMRGCDNMCTYCIVPFVRGRERSRPIKSILDEVRHLADKGIREVTLLGQNVNSYRDLSEVTVAMGENVKRETEMAKGFKTVYKTKLGGKRFADLLEKVADIDPEMRIRFTSPHPKDFPDEVLELISSKPNICKQIHLPAQSGNSEVLERMRRGYTRESYLELVQHIRDIIPDIKLSSDFIAGFCGETDEEFEDTITLIETVQYHMAYLFQYSMREKTTAHRRFKDDVPPEVKLARLQRMASLFRTQAEKLNSFQVGTRQLVLIEGRSRRSDSVLQGRTDGNTRVLVPKLSIPDQAANQSREIKSGDYIAVQISESNSNSLTGVPLYHSSIAEFENRNNNNHSNSDQFEHTDYL
ncbi:CDK5RAP1-like protein [Microplitis mediator]|uniref:CDK5RAP1-like protein n=1 Tax=Microplitis mediator TaxID=375433 RepID=UPI0025572360|nr:CDK5RAP1-like protein [Microplitis mediator]